MDILGIGPMELLLILIVMLLVFGPDKLPQMGAKLGRAMRDMRKATRAISNEINATRDAITAEAKPVTDPLQEMAAAAKSAQSLVSAAKNPGQAIRESVMKELNPPPPAAEGEPVAEDTNVIAPPEAQAAVVTATPLEPDAAPAAPDPELPSARAEDAEAPAPPVPAEPDETETRNPPPPTGAEPAGEQ